MTMPLASSDSLKKAATLLRKCRIMVGEPRNVEELLDNLVVAAETAIACQEGRDFFDDDDLDEADISDTNTSRVATMPNATTTMSLDGRRRRRRPRDGAAAAVARFYQTLKPSWLR
jgi:hypothetical protein